MSLTSGTRLGAYQITGLIGVGGMGEVYRASDTKLGREVAIKTLPSELAKDPDRLARFQREAKLLAALNHAHIAAIYGLHEHEGMQFLAMELVEGETLERKLKDARMPVEEALQLALQIAEALEAAHEKGVMHRDLKPANIMVSGNGQVKVLDFGLAKAFTADPKQTAVGHSPALSLAMTQQGLVLGTAGYMSPEQASGQATDQRADIWAFGVVLYEMLAGSPLFSGESVPHILADVLKTEPDWSRLPTNLHPRLKLLLERCLKKKVRDRYHSMADVRVDIEDVLRDPQGVAAAATAQPSSRRVLPFVAAALVVGGALVGLVGWSLWPPAVPRPVNRFDWAFPPNQAFLIRNAGYSVAALSPDGRYFAYGTPQGLYVRAMSELEARVIPGTEKDGAGEPFFSPDSQSVAYFARGQLKRVGLGGGAPVVVADGLARLSFGASWGPDGTILFGQPDGIFRVSANGGKPEPLIRAKDELLSGPALLPDKDSVLFSRALGRDPTTSRKAQVVVQTLSTGKRTTLVDSGFSARYVPTGHLIYAAADGLFAIAFDASRLAVSGSAVSVAQGILRAQFGIPAANYGVSADGTLVYVSASSPAAAERYMPVWVDRQGREEPLGLEPCYCIGPTVSPDGTRVALSVITADRQNADIRVWSLAQRTLQRLPPESGLQEGPLWTPDSVQIAYASTAEGGGIFLRHADGTGAPERLVQGFGLVAWGWSADGDLIFNSDRLGATASVGVLAVAGDRRPKTLLATNFRSLDGALSPDGRWLAYESDESGHYEIYVRPYPDVEAHQWVISSGGGEEPKWAPDGRTLFFRSAKSLMAAVVETAHGFSFRAPEPVLDITGYEFFRGPPRTYDVSPDGRRFLLVKPVTGTAADSVAQPLQIVIVQNWTEELKRRVPKK
jgi:serine/threonine-protein kinase